MAIGVDDDRGAVVALADLLGDVRYQRVGGGRQRIGLHQRPARRGQRDHAARYVGVQRRHDHRHAVLAGDRQHLIGRLRAVRRDHQRGAEVDRQSLRVGAVADHDDVPVGDPAGCVDVHRVHPHAARQHRVVAGHQFSLEHLGDRPDRSRRLLQGRGLPRLAGVPAGQRAFGDHPDQPAPVVDHRDELELGAGHCQAGLADRLLLAGHREVGTASRRAPAAARAPGTSARVRRCGPGATAFGG